jgi:hypothetical protein
MSFDPEVGRRVFGEQTTEYTVQEYASVRRIALDNS